MSTGKNNSFFVEKLTETGNKNTEGNVLGPECRPDANCDPHYCRPNNGCQPDYDTCMPYRDHCIPAKGRDEGMEGMEGEKTHKPSIKRT